MKVQSTVFALFLVASAFLSTRSSAQTNSLQPKSELEASREANQFGEEIRRNESQASQAQKGQNRSADAMHWNFIVVNQPLAADNEKPATINEFSTTRARDNKQANKSVKTVEKPVYN